MKFMLLLILALSITSCASSGSGKGASCVEQPDCIIGCIVKDNTCEREKEDDAG